MPKSFEELPKIIAVDFDGTLVEDRWPEIGSPNIELFEILKSLRQNYGIKIILWTCRNYHDKYGDMLEEAIKFCQKQGLEFDAINENIREVQKFTGEDTRKVYADVYIDDKGIAEDVIPARWLSKVGLSWNEILGSMSFVKEIEGWQ